MLIEVSIGEAIDKLSILELKQKKITNVIKLEEVNKEIKVLSSCEKIKNQHKTYYKMLIYVNEQIWDLTDQIKGMSSESQAGEYICLAESIFDFNQKRFRLKKIINHLCASNIKEQKSYGETHCRIIVPDRETLYQKLPEINYLFIEYDIVTFETDIIEVKSIFPSFETDIHVNVTVNIKTFDIDPKLRNIFDFEPITYHAGGMLGDFIHFLSIINEKYLQTGRKGTLYLMNKDTFRYGLERAFADTYKFVMEQQYIHSFQIHKGETTDVDLNDWRRSHLLYKVNWHFIFKDYYNVSWGVHPWILTNQVDVNLKDKILVCQTSIRVREIDYPKFFQEHGLDISEAIFLTQDENQTCNDMPIHHVKSLDEMIIAINSCKLYIGNLSSPTAIANALHKKSITLLSPILKEDNTHVHGLEKIVNTTIY